MKSYNKENTILVFTKDKKLFIYIQHALKSMEINLYQVKYKSDIVAVPSFMLIIESGVINPEITNLITEVSQFESPKEWNIVVIGKLDSKLPVALKKYITVIRDITTNNTLTLHVLKSFKMFNKEQNRMKIMNKKIYRIIKLYIDTQIKNNHSLDVTTYCIENGISERTLRRDVKLLKDIDPYFTIYLNNPMDIKPRKQ